MRTLLMLSLAMLCVGCSARGAADRHLDAAYRHYAEGNCQATFLALSQAERRVRRGNPFQAEISLLRGQCLEREKLYVDAVQTYRFIRHNFPQSEYAYRAAARLDTLRRAGHIKDTEGAVAVSPVTP